MFVSVKFCLHCGDPTKMVNPAITCIVGAINVPRGRWFNKNTYIFHIENKNMTKIFWRDLGCIDYHPGYVGGACILFDILFYLRLFCG